ncbi:ATP-binding protein [Bacillus sp. B190/17]|uniref:histidine kinase n=1 Tax=Bacillus lumedeiriae TaxID=3058829 RepID=A0ABW8ICL7_9BACI
MKNIDVCFETLKAQCKEQGLDPLSIPAFKDTLDMYELQKKHSKHEKFLKVVNHFFEKFLSSMKGVPILTATTDEEGYMILLRGDETIKNTINQLGVKEGCRFTEEVNGINAISLSLKHNRPIAIVGSQHYHHFLHVSACYSVPITDPVTEKILGTITFMTSVDHSSPLLLTLLLTMKDSIERELQLLRQNEKLNIMNQLIMDTTRNGMMVSDKAGKIIGFNHAAEHITGLKKETILFQCINQLETFTPYLKNVLEEEQQYTDVEISFVRKDGQEMTVLFDALPILDEEQQTIGALAQMKDITRRKQTEQLLLNAEKLAAVGQMAASVAHEIRNPLTTVRGFIQLVKEDFKEGSHFHLVLDEIDRINFIISEFLVLSKPNVVHFHTKDVKQVLDETIALFQAQASMNNTQIATEFGNNELIINCNDNQLKQVFINLFKNSMEAMPFGGKLTIRVNQKGKQAVSIQIIDEGEGMREEQIQRLGTPFYTTKETGTGLGYMIIKRIIEQHDGMLDIHSKANKGTAVEITLPLAVGALR